MNAMLIEQTKDNFSGEYVPPLKLVEAGDPSSQTLTANDFSRRSTLPVHRIRAALVYRLHPIPLID